MSAARSATIFLSCRISSTVALVTHLSAYIVSGGPSPHAGCTSRTRPNEPQPNVGVGCPTAPTSSDSDGMPSASRCRFHIIWSFSGARHSVRVGEPWASSDGAASPLSVTCPWSSSSSPTPCVLPPPVPLVDADPPASSATSCSKHDVGDSSAAAPGATAPRFGRGGGAACSAAAVSASGRAAETARCAASPSRPEACEGRRQGAGTGARQTERNSCEEARRAPRERASASRAAAAAPVSRTPEGPPANRLACVVGRVAGGAPTRRTPSPRARPRRLCVRTLRNSTLA